MCNESPLSGSLIKRRTVGLGEGQDSQETCHIELWAMFACVDLLFTSWLLLVAHLSGAKDECMV